ncbi:hypothetical protein [Marinicellulosiphila megalodicopiae]|uniref:hypothetical protein n=1 Tax=Marinicellulosiphila megalodicopiae TaxID=2724896 RepID=UPI003BAE8FFC
MNNIIKEINYKKHIIGLSILSTSFVFLIFSLYFFIGTYKENKDQKTRVASQVHINEQAVSQLELFNEYYPRYLELKKQGLIGQGNRLQWLETLKTASEKYNIPALNFTLEQSSPSDSLIDLYENPEVSFQTAIMSLNFQILHEGDFYHLVQYLHNNADGLFSVESCELRLVNEFNYSGMAGSCKLKWFYLEDFTTQWTTL